MKTRIATFIFAGLGSGIGLYLALMVLEREPPVIVTASRVVTPQVEPGGTLKMEVEILRTRRCETSVDRIIFDAAGARHVLDRIEFQSAGGARGEEKYLNLIPVPTDAAPGPARYRSIATYRCNPLHHSWPIVGEPREVGFEIVSAGVTPVQR